MEQTERVVVGVDGSPVSMEALAWALRYAEKTGAAVAAVYGWQPPVVYGTAVEAVPGESFTETAERALNESVDAALDGREDLVVERTAALGHPAKVLIEQSKTAGLLVVGSRGQGGIKGTLLGSVSLHCVTNADCPVVVIRAAE
ncbi:universal stress protein [Glycomyces artemisiae]|uniref:Nucleotide-binding universal stress UspA family protein n=1 Tax=Glycomyces artemisiae TaxID=1076443 RepID=A0A2T0UDH0_9ACTN|nr:universal stress protein [Glycomyces artemisiae]PRY55969.1 nucleotide-binding universal stress UspA family protein [Glycomyces artemisiae]